MLRSNPGGDRPSSPFADRPLIVQSHLRWDFVWQRPQQLLSRLASYAPVLFVEEPLFLDDARKSRLDISVPAPNVLRAVPMLTADLRADGDRAIDAVRALVQESVSDTGPLKAAFKKPVQWFYSPMNAPSMLGAFNEVGVVYDCMDELSKFRFAHPDLPRRERLLLASADVVFTGGHKLYESKRRHHRNVHFFGCGVDVNHFGKARLDATEVPADVAQLPKPVYGYFGVVDERIDYDLIAKLAAAKPDASVVIVGPVVKVDPASLPQGANIHWLGQRDYSELPGYLKGFDVCLMPFALNEATEYINPTKTLEYMAAAKPIVSTAVADVVHNFTPVVAIGRTREEFVARAAALGDSPDPALIEQGLEMAARSSWENIVTRMRSLIQSAVVPAVRAPRAHRATERSAELAVQ